MSLVQSMFVFLIFTGCAIWFLLEVDRWHPNAIKYSWFKYCPIPFAIIFLISFAYHLRFLAFLALIFLLATTISGEILRKSKEDTDPQ